MLATPWPTRSRFLLLEVSNSGHGAVDASTLPFNSIING
jgi:hypothetical protein